MKKCLTCTRFEPPFVSREVSDAVKKKQKQTNQDIVDVAKQSGSNIEINEDQSKTVCSVGQQQIS